MNAPGIKKVDKQKHHNMAISPLENAHITFLENAHITFERFEAKASPKKRSRFSTFFPPQGPGATSSIAQTTTYRWFREVHLKKVAG